MGARNLHASGDLPRSHGFEEAEVLLDAARAVRRVAPRLSEAAAVPVVGVQVSVVGTLWCGT